MGGAGSPVSGRWSAAAPPPPSCRTRRSSPASRAESAATRRAQLLGRALALPTTTGLQAGARRAHLVEAGDEEGLAGAARRERAVGAGAPKLVRLLRRHLAVQLPSHLPCATPPLRCVSGATPTRHQEGSARGRMEGTMGRTSAMGGAGSPVSGCLERRAERVVRLLRAAQSQRPHGARALLKRASDTAPSLRPSGATRAPCGGGRRGGRCWGGASGGGSPSARPPPSSAPCCPAPPPPAPRGRRCGALPAARRRANRMSGGSEVHGCRAGEGRERASRRRSARRRRTSYARPRPRRRTRTTTTTASRPAPV